MTITSTEHDRRMILYRLAAAGVAAYPARVATILDQVEAAFQQQLGDEADYLINELEANL